MNNVYNDPLDNQNYILYNMNDVFNDPLDNTQIIPSRKGIILQRGLEHFFSKVYSVTVTVFSLQIEETKLLKKSHRKFLIMPNSQRWCGPR